MDAALRQAERAYAAEPLAEGTWEALQCVQARAGQLVACDTCGERRETVALRDSGSHECHTCYSEALEHGHRHGMHDEEPAEHCPRC